jgi:tuberous sclerosis protein 2
LQNGLVLVSGKTSVLRQCILSLTICAMEMQEAMTKSLPETLLSLSKISATIALSIPKLEFLSSILNLNLILLNFN